MKRPFAELLKPHRRVCLDTSIFIYFVEQHPRYFDFCNAVFRHLENGGLTAVTSTLTLLELLVQPYRQKKEQLVLKYYSLFTTYPNLSWVQLDLGVSDLASRIRAEHGLKTPDAIQIASALRSDATCFICNDSAFRKVDGIECMLVDDVI